MIAVRRAKARIPETVRIRPKWEPALEMLDELAVWGRECPAVVADAGYGDNSHFRAALSARGIPWVMAVKAGNTAYLADAVPERLASTGPGRPSVPRYRQDPSTLAALALAAGAQLRQATWRHGTRTGPGNRTAAMKSRFLALRVRPANRHIPRAADGSAPPGLDDRRMASRRG